MDRQVGTVVGRAPRTPLKSLGPARSFIAGAIKSFYWQMT